MKLLSNMDPNIVNMTVDQLVVYGVDKFRNEEFQYGDYFVKYIAEGYHSRLEEPHYTIRYKFGQKIRLRNNQADLLRNLGTCGSVLGFLITLWKLSGIVIKRKYERSQAIKIINLEEQHY